MIHFEGVSKHYERGFPSLDDITLRITPGEFVTIVGHSGAGKTTLVRLLLGEEKPTGGKVHFDGVDIHSLRSHEIPVVRRRMGTVFQDYKLLPTKTAFENVAFAMEAAGRTDDDIVSDVPYALELVGLGNKARSFPGQMSGGERQRLAIARAIINQPEVIIADEPTGNLDPVATREIIEILKKINDLGTTVILTTHNKGVVDDLGKRVITIKGGRIIRDDPQGRYEL